MTTSSLPTAGFAPIFRALFQELAVGSPDPAARTFILNQGDLGLFEALDRLSAEAASVHERGPSVAAHVDHLRYGLSLLNGWARGEYPPWPEMDWTVSWRKLVVSPAEWLDLRRQLRREAGDWMMALTVPREVSEVEAGWVVGSVAHLAYHMGAIRQIDRSARGPAAEDEVRHN